MLMFPILTIIVFALFFVMDRIGKDKLCIACGVLTLIFGLVSFAGFYATPKQYERIDSYTYRANGELTETITISTDSCLLYEKDDEIYVKPIDAEKGSWKYYIIPFNDEMIKVKVNGELLNIEYPDARVVQYREAPSIESLTEGE